MIYLHLAVLTEGPSYDDPNHLVEFWPSDDYLLKAGCFGVDAGYRAEQPAADRTEGVMIEGVHAGVLEAFLLGPTVPAFPDGGRAIHNGITPRRKGVILEQSARDIMVAVVAQDKHDVWTSQKSGGKVPVFRFDFFVICLLCKGTSLQDI